MTYLARNTVKYEKHYLVFCPLVHECEFPSTPVPCCKSSVPSCIMLAAPLPLQPLNPTLLITPD